MTKVKGTGQGSGGKGLLITAITEGSAQVLHTAVTGTALTQLLKVGLVNNSAVGVEVTLVLIPDDASANVLIVENIPAQGRWFPLIPDGFSIPVNDTMVVSVFAATASVVTAYAIVDDQTATVSSQVLQSGEVTLVQNANAFRMNGVVSSTAEADHELLIPTAGTLTNLRARALTNIGGGATVTVVVRVNGGDVALTFTYAVAETTTLVEDNGSVVVAAGDRVTINFATDNGGAPAATMLGTVDFVGS